MSRVIDFERYRHLREITAVCEGTCDHHDSCDYPPDGILYADDDCDAGADDDFMWDFEP